MSDFPKLCRENRKRQWHCRRPYLPSPGTKTARRTLSIYITTAILSQINHHLLIITSTTTPQSPTNQTQPSTASTSSPSPPTEPHLPAASSQQPCVRKPSSRTRAATRATTPWLHAASGTASGSRTSTRACDPGAAPAVTRVVAGVTAAARERREQRGW